jgi:hypothetical protein
MPCETCGCAVRITHADEPQDSGAFKEEYECAQGHKGYIYGQEGELPENWSRFGQVFE